jgi:internalin A
MSELAIKLINEAYEKQSTFLDLGCCGLTEIPEEILKLKDCLEHLNLGRWYRINGELVETTNKLERNTFFASPSSLNLLSELGKITTLGLFHAEIGDNGTEYIGKLAALSSLDLSVNVITSRGVEYISRLSSLTSLYISSNDIGEKGAEYLSRLTNLTSLNLYYNKIGEKGAEYISRLSSLKSLDISENGVGEKGVEYISRLSSLTLLDIWSNSIGEKGAEYISRLTNLTSLNIYYNKIGDKGAEYISRLSSLTLLNISNNEIGDKGTEYVSRLSSLTSLNISDNGIGEKGVGYIGKLSSLSSLDISNNEIGEKGAEYISRLSSLTSLNISLNRIGEKGAEYISMLSSLTSLDIWGNEIGDKGAEHISKLSSLTSLEISANQIKDNGASYISKLPSLSDLSLMNNNITTFNPIVNNKIRTLKLQNNAIEHLAINLLKRIPLEIDTVEESSFYEGKLFLKGNPIKNIPPEVLQKGRAAILEYLEGNLRPLNECKLIFVGDGGVGKTSLMKRLVGKKFTRGEHTTHGINKIAWQGFENAKGETIKLNLWDFGGQHIQHSLHQFFFTPRAVYVLVLNPRNDEKAAYWLDQVDKLGYGSQLIIVYNWKEERDIQADWSKNFKELRKAYKYLPDPIVLSCKTGEGMEVFEERVRAAVLANEGLTTQYPETWFNIKQRLEEGIPVEKHYIEYHEYVQWCTEKQYNDPERQRTLLKILDSVGAIVFFDKPVLNNLQVLNPEWISTGAYTILTSDITGKKKGHLAWADLQEIFRTPKEIFSDKKISIKYTEQQFAFILELMKDYRLLQLNPFKAHEYLIPSAFGEQPKEYDITNSRHYRLKFGSAFEMLVIHRFIAKNILHIQGADYWHSGIYFKHAGSNTWALVETNQYSQEINCWIKGDNIRGLWEVIRNDFREIFSMYHNLPVEEEVEYTSDGRTVFLKYNQMLAALRKGVRKIPYDPATELENIDVNAVLELFEPVKENLRIMGNEQHGQETSPHVTVNINNNPNQQVLNNQQITANPTFTNNPVNTVTEPAPSKEAPKPATHDTAAEDKAVRKWKNKALVTFLISAVITLILVLAWVNHWWFSEANWKWLNDNEVIKWIGIVLAAAWNSFVVKALYDRFLDPSKAKAYRETLRK